MNLSRWVCTKEPPPREASWRRSGKSLGACPNLRLLGRRGSMVGQRFTCRGEEVATLGRGIAGNEVCDTLLEDARDIPIRRVVRLAINRDTLRLETVVELVYPGRLHGKARVRALGELCCIVVAHCEELLALRRDG